MSIKSFSLSESEDTALSDPDVSDSGSKSERILGRGREHSMEY